MLTACLMATNAQAQQAAAATAPVPVVITPSATQYKVIDLTKISLPANGTEAAVLERLLNELSAQGWQVVAPTGNLIILKR
ncbi:MAG: hypothetical protein ACO1TE_26095 [Prosthecobacter sp.]